MREGTSPEVGGLARAFSDRGGGWSGPHLPPEGGDRSDPLPNANCEKKFSGLEKSQKSRFRAGFFFKCMSKHTSKFFVFPGQDFFFLGGLGPPTVRRGGGGGVVWTPFPLGGGVLGGGVV